ncbi:hypothetical protein TD95_001380, partial [Thielaviopsis punctulata]
MLDDDMLQRLAALEDSSKQLPDLIGQCSNFEFTPGALPLSISDENSASGELLAETMQLIRELEDELDILGEEIKDGHEENLARLKDSHEHLVKQLSHYRVAFRRAQVAARANLAAAVQKERQLIISAYTDPAPNAPATVPHPADRNASSLLQRHTALSEEDQQTVGASTDVTLALRRTHDLIAAELARSEYAHQTLVESSQALAQLNESYGSLEGMLASSRDLLGTLVRSQKSDTWYLQTSLYMLLGTLAWLVFRRFLYGPVWWLVWLPLRLIFGTGWMVGKAVVPVGRGKVKTGEVPEGQVKVQVEGMPSEDLPTLSVVQARESAVKAKESMEIEEKQAKEEEEVSDVKKQFLSEEVDRIINSDSEVVVEVDDAIPEPRVPDIAEKASQPDVEEVEEVMVVEEVEAAPQQRHEKDE